MWTKKLLAVLCLLPLASSAFAAGTISGVSGTISNGSTITISGSGFGTKSTAGPLRFDTFESGTAGSTLSSPWQSYGGGMSYSTTQAHAGTKAAYANITNGENFNTSYYTFTASDECYYSYWWRTTNLSDSDGNNTKMGRISPFNDSDPYSGPGTISLTTYMWGDGGPYLAYHLNTTGENGVEGWRHIAVDANVWNRVDCFGKVSSPAGTANGRVECTIIRPSGNDTLTTGNFVSRPAGGTWQYGSVLLGAMDGSVSSHSYQIYIDDVYVDNTRARVEICKESTWNARRHCEVQPATSWVAGGNSIAVTVNRGTFGATEAAYLYVVSSDGTVSSGYGITFGDSGGPDTTPDQFTYTDITNATLSTQYTSNTITVAGIDVGQSVAVSILGGTYSKNGGSYTSAAGTASVGDTFAVRVTSSGSYSTAVSAILTIGGVSDTYSVTTLSDPPPVMSNPLPSTQQPCNPNPATVTIQLTTNENATCRWSLTNVAYDSMANVYGTTGGTAHSATVTGLACNQAQHVYSQCRDAGDNKTVTAADHSFSIAAADTTPPVVSAALPNAPQSCAGPATPVTLSVTTNENATCKYGTTDADYAALPATMSGSSLSHTATVTRACGGAPVVYYVRCQDTSGNPMASAQAVRVDIPTLELKGESAIIGGAMN